MLEVGIEVRFMEAAAEDDDADGLAASRTAWRKLVGLGDGSRVHQMPLGMRRRRRQGCP